MAPDRSITPLVTPLPRMGSERELEGPGVVGTLVVRELLPREPIASPERVPAGPGVEGRV